MFESEPMTNKITVRDYIDQYRTPKSELARMIGILRVELYAYLEPAKYPNNRLGESQLQKIAKFEGRPVSAVRKEYQQAA